MSIKGKSSKAKFKRLVPSCGRFIWHAAACVRNFDQGTAETTIGRLIIKE